LSSDILTAGRARGRTSEGREQGPWFAAL